MLWAALHDRPVSWACQRRHWSTTTLKPWRLPSPSTMSRRIDGVAVGLLGRALERRLRDSGRPALVAFVDGKPLPIGGNGKDPDARFGRGAGCLAKGYKLHTVWSNRAMPEAWEITPLNAGEKAVAERLIGRLEYGGYLLADGNDDASYLYEAAFDHRLSTGFAVPQGQDARLRQALPEPAPTARPGDPGQGGFGKALFKAQTLRRSSVRSGMRRRSGAGWARCRRGCGAWSGCGRGCGPSCSSTPSASATDKDLRPSLQDVVCLGTRGREALLPVSIQTRRELRGRAFPSRAWERGCCALPDVFCQGGSPWTPARKRPPTPPAPPSAPVRRPAAPPRGPATCAAGYALFLPTGSLVQTGRDSGQAKAQEIA